MGQLRLEKTEEILSGLINMAERGSEVDGAMHFSAMPSDRTRGSRHKLKHRSFTFSEAYRTPEQAAHRGGSGLLLWRNSKPAWTFSYVTYSTEPALAVELD